MPNSKIDLNFKPEILFTEKGQIKFQEILDELQAFQIGECASFAVQTEMVTRMVCAILKLERPKHVTIRIWNDDKLIFDGYSQKE